MNVNFGMQNIISQATNNGTIIQRGAPSLSLESDSKSDSNSDGMEDDEETDDEADDSETLASDSSHSSESDSPSSEDNLSSDEDKYHRAKMQERLIGRKKMGVSFTRCHVLLQLKSKPMELGLKWARRKLKPALLNVRRCSFSGYLRQLEVAHLILKHVDIKLTDGKKSAAKLLLLDRLHKTAQRNALMSSILAVGDFATYFVLFDQPPAKLKRRDVCVISLPRQTFMVCNSTVAFLLPENCTLVAYRLANHSRFKPNIASVPHAVAIIHGRLHSYLRDEVASEVKVSWIRKGLSALQNMKCNVLEKMSKIMGLPAWLHAPSGRNLTNTAQFDLIENSSTSSASDKTRDTLMADAAKQMKTCTGWTVKEFQVVHCTHLPCQKQLHTIWNKNRRNVWRRKCINCGALQ